MQALSETRFVNCATCHTEGFIEYGHPNAPHPTHTETCPDCKGERVVEVEVEPVALSEEGWCSACGYPLDVDAWESGEADCTSCQRQAARESARSE